MASKAKSRANNQSSEDVSELLDELQTRMDRCKVMFEQYFLGIQKKAPLQLQIELERRIRKLTQTHITNTGLRFRFTTLSQKFASYNTYWKRTLRQIENGTYIRDIAKLGREAIRDGKDIPDELLAKMPKRMRERIQRDRDQVRGRAKRDAQRETELRASDKVRDIKHKNVHQIEHGDLLEDLDMDSLFAGMTGEGSASSAEPAKTVSPVPGGGTASRAKPIPSAKPAPAKKDQRFGRPVTDADVDEIFARTLTPPPPADNSAIAGRVRPSEPPKRAMAKPAPAATPQRTPAPTRQRTPAPTPQRTPAPTPRPSPAAQKPPPGMSVTESQALYSRYKKARELVGKDTSNLSYKRLMTSLNKQAPKILKDHKATGVSFDVVVKGDRVVLKAKPKK